MTNMIAKERLYLTTDKERLVREGDEAGAILYCAAGDEIPQSAVDRFKLVDGTIASKGGKPDVSGGKSAGGGSTKEKQPGQDKEKQPGGDKGAGDGSAGAAATGDDLTRIKYVGTKVAKGFAAAGLTTFAQIAAIDSAAPPAVEGTNATTKWGDIVESAKELLDASVGASAPVEGQGAADAAGGGEAGAGAADQGAS